MFACDLDMKCSRAHFMLRMCSTNRNVTDIHDEKLVAFAVKIFVLRLGAIGREMEHDALDAE